MKKVAVIEGGYSKEKAISIKSAKTVFDNLDRIKFEQLGKGMNSHEDSFLWARECDLDVNYTLDESVDHDLVRAIYEDCHYKEEFSGINKLTKYKQYPRDNGRF